MFFLLNLFVHRSHQWRRESLTEGDEREEAVAVEESPRMSSGTYGNEEVELQTRAGATAGRNSFCIEALLGPPREDKPQQTQQPSAPPSPYTSSHSHSPSISPGSEGCIYNMPSSPNRTDPFYKNQGEW